MTSTSWYRSTYMNMRGNACYTRAGYEAAAAKFDPSELDVDCTGRHMLITGASRGLGLCTAQELARRGAVLHLVCRDQQRAEQARQDIVTGTGNDKIHMYFVDLSEPREVVRFCDEFVSTHEELHVLVNNAGVMRHERHLDEDGIEYNFAVNTLAVHLMTVGLMPLLERSERSHVITVSSAGMLSVKLDPTDLSFANMSPFNGRLAYSQTKRQQVVLTLLYAQSFHKVHFSCMHPGWADTHSVRTALPEFYETMKDKLRTAEQGADTIVWLAISQRAKTFNSGLFFQDREAVSTHLPLAWTRSNISEEKLLLQNLEEIAARVRQPRPSPDEGDAQVRAEDSARSLESQNKESVAEVTSKAEEKSVHLGSETNISKGETTKRETTKGETAKEDAAKEETSKEETSKGETSKGETSKGETSKGETAKGETAKEDAAKRETSKGETAKEETAKEETAKEEIAKGETSKGETSKGETSKGETSKGETSKGETSKGETSKGETFKGESVKEEADKEEIAKEETAKKEIDNKYSKVEEEHEHSRSETDISVEENYNKHPKVELLHSKDALKDVAEEINISEDHIKICESEIQSNPAPNTDKVEASEIHPEMSSNSEQNCSKYALLEEKSEVSHSESHNIKIAESDSKSEISSNSEHDSSKIAGLEDESEVSFSEPHNDKIAESDEKSDISSNSDQDSSKMLVSTEQSERANAEQNNNMIEEPEVHSEIPANSGQDSSKIAELEKESEVSFSESHDDKISVSEVQLDTSSNSQMNSTNSTTPEKHSGSALNVTVSSIEEKKDSSNCTSDLEDSEKVSIVPEDDSVSSKSESHDTSTDSIAKTLQATKIDDESKKSTVS